MAISVAERTDQVLGQFRLVVVKASWADNDTYNTGYHVVGGWANKNNDTAAVVSVSNESDGVSVKLNGAGDAGSTFYVLCR